MNITLRLFYSIDIWYNFQDKTKKWSLAQLSFFKMNWTKGKSLFSFVCPLTSSLIYIYNIYIVWLLASMLGHMSYPLFVTYNSSISFLLDTFFLSLSFFLSGQMCPSATAVVVVHVAMIMVNVRVVCVFVCQMGQCRVGTELRLLLI